MATIDDTGASVRTLQQYIQDIQNQYLAIDAAWNIESESPDGQAIGIWAELLANLDESVIAAYQSVDPRVAVGEQLDRIAALNLLNRQVGTFSTATVQLTGTPSTGVPQGTEFRNTETDTLWASDSAVTLDGDGNSVVNVTCTTTGAEPAAVGTISEIATPVAGLSSVNNADAAALGRDRESDQAFRLRRNRSVGRPGNNQVDSMFAELADIEGVNRIRIYENETNVTDSDSLLPHSLAIIIDGGDVEEIAEGIAARKNPGTSLNRLNTTIANKVTQATTTPAGNPFEATFFRPDLVTIHVRVEIEGDFNADTVKSAIVDYANGTLFDEGIGFDRDGFSIGDSVPVGKIYTPVNRVLAGQSFATLVEIGTSPGALSGTTISVGFNGLAVFDAASIEVVAA